MAGKKVVKKRVVKKRRVEEDAPQPAEAAETAAAVAAESGDESEGMGEEILGAGGSDDQQLSAKDMLAQMVSMHGQTASDEDDDEEDEELQAEDEEEDEEVILTEHGLGVKRKKLWEDDDDTAAGAPKLSAAQSRRPTPAWAEVKDDAQSEEGDDISSEEGELDPDIYRNTRGLVDRRKALPSGTIDYQMVKDANEAEVSHAALSAVHFHPSGTILLTASPDYRLRLFQADGTTSTKLQTVSFKDMPPMNARFTPCGSKIICSGKRPEYSVVDVQSSTVSVVKSLSRVERNLSVFACSPHSSSIAFSSQTGSVHFVTSNTHQPMFSLRGDGPSNGIAFNKEDENQVWTIGGNKVYVWDVRTRRPLRIHADEGSQMATSIDVSGATGLYAVGSSNGIVNVYDIPSSFPSNPLAAAPAPRKALASLTTATQFSVFNGPGEVLCMGSEKKKNSVRLVHTASLTTFQNFPRVNHYYRKPTCADFSPSSGLLCVGNDRGRALLFRLPYYGNA
eukprot:TRINITY_DN27065_c0_g1_i1.p1 TRINITY_DN27065_c0_g1~~TRINITY_DN27065_c0_g1_i1.p1  ORF type:complete len:507 (+),score=187.48 TRINITY_DN27065_c0_g1_i1:100-1620(+)